MLLQKLLILEDQLQTIVLMGLQLKALLLQEHLQITLETAATLRSSDLMTGSVAPESARQKILDRRS